MIVYWSWLYLQMIGDGIYCAFLRSRYNPGLIHHDIFFHLCATKLYQARLARGSTDFYTVAVAISMPIDNNNTQNQNKTNKKTKTRIDGQGAFHMRLTNGAMTSLKSH